MIKFLAKNDQISKLFRRYSRLVHSILRHKPNIPMFYIFKWFNQSFFTFKIKYTGETDNTGLFVRMKTIAKLSSQTFSFLFLLLKQGTQTNSVLHEVNLDSTLHMTYCFMLGQYQSLNLTDSFFSLSLIVWFCSLDYDFFTCLRSSPKSDHLGQNCPLIRPTRTEVSLIGISCARNSVSLKCAENSSAQKLLLK